MADVKVYVHPVPASTALLSFLSAHLPCSLPLLRCLQYRGDLSRTSTLIASFPPSLFPFSVPTLSATCTPTAKLAAEPPFAIGYFDRGSKPDTEGWLFSSMQLFQQQNDSETPKSTENSTRREVEVEQILAIFRHLRQVSASPIHSFPSTFDGVHNGITNGTDTYDITTEDIVLVGSLHRSIRDCLSKHPSGCLRDDILGPGGPYQKYIIPVAALRLQRSYALHLLALPSRDLNYCEIKPSDYEFVMAQNKFVRSTRALHSLPNCGIRHSPTGRLVAFAFIGFDGSLKRLHVEPTWRGMNLGGLLVKMLLTQRDADFTTTVECQTNSNAAKVSAYSNRTQDICSDIAHADVSTTNIASVRLFEKLGATTAWEVFWVRIDMQRVMQ